MSKKKSARFEQCSGQIIAAIAVGLGPLTAGLGKGYSSPAIASLQQCDANAFHLDSQQASWLASLSLLGALFGAPLGGVAVSWGRRRTLLLTGPTLALCWLLAALATNVQIMCLAAFISGLLVAIIQLAAQVYVSEIADPKVRGGLSGLLKVLCQAGVVMAYTVGAFFNWRQLAGFISVVPLVMCMAMWWMPESPGWLILQGDLRAAHTALQWLRGPNVELHVEPILTSIYKPKLQLLKRPVFIAAGLMFFQRFSGANAFYFYVVPIFKQTFDKTNPHSAAISVALVQLLSSLLSGLLVDTIGRIPLLLASSMLMSVALASFGSYAYYEDIYKSTNLDWIPLLCVLIFTIAFSLGISPISWLLVTELFTLEYRGLATASAISFSYFCSFVAVKTFVDFEQHLGLYGAFWLYAFISICGLCFVVCFVPETKGKYLMNTSENQVTIEERKTR